MKCSDCGLDHWDQMDALPTDARVLSITTFDPDIVPGMFGKVVGHCDDGRANVEFSEDGPLHSFHQHEQFIARVRE